jgi:hypothetical protein
MIARVSIYLRNRVQYPDAHSAIPETIKPIETRV